MKQKAAVDELFTDEEKRVLVEKMVIHRTRQHEDFIVFCRKYLGMPVLPYQSFIINNLL